MLRRWREELEVQLRVLILERWPKYFSSFAVGETNIILQLAAELSSSVLMVVTWRDWNSGQVSVCCFLRKFCDILAILNISLCDWVDWLVFCGQWHEGKESWFSSFKQAGTWGKKSDKLKQAPSSARFKQAQYKTHCVGDANPVLAYTLLVRKEAYSGGYARASNRVSQ